MPGWFGDFAAALADGDAEYLACEACGHATLPPRQVCPDCGGRDLAREPLPDRGTVRSFTEISVTTPRFHGETPYTVVLADLEGTVTLTGQLRDATAGDVAIGDAVTVGAEAREDGPAVVTFRPA